MERRTLTRVVSSMSLAIVAVFGCSTSSGTHDTMIEYRWSCSCQCVCESSVCNGGGTQQPVCTCNSAIAGACDSTCAKTKTCDDVCLDAYCSGFKSLGGGVQQNCGGLKSASGQCMRL